MRDNIGRRNPAEGVLIFRGQPTIVFLTVCARNRRQCLANANVHDALVASWEEADAWLISCYLIMPDHIHVFCSPVNEGCEIEHWISFWKRRSRRRYGENAPRFQSRGFHHRLRRSENYRDKWDYVQANPVRAGLVKDASAWPYQGVLNELVW
jgi:putative transposase